jgi:hypothetical protein
LSWAPRLYSSARQLGWALVVRGAQWSLLIVVSLALGLRGRLRVCRQLAEPELDSLPEWAIERPAARLSLR